MPDAASRTGLDHADLLKRAAEAAVAEGDFARAIGLTEAAMREGATWCLYMLLGRDVADGSWAGETYERLYRMSGADEDAESVLDYLEAMLAGAGWVELDQSTWEGGLEQSLLRRGEHC